MVFLGDKLRSHRKTKTKRSLKEWVKKNGVVRGHSWASREGAPVEDVQSVGARPALLT